jgi:hypothetical protein
VIFTENVESSESLHSKWWKSDNKMQTQENDTLTSASNKFNISASNVDQSINKSSKLKYDSSSLKKNKIISSHQDSTSWIEQYEATVSSSSQQMKSQQNMMIFDHSVTENLARESDHTRSNMNLNDDKDNEQNLKKCYVKWLKYQSWFCFLTNKIEQTHDEDIIDCYKASSWRKQMTKLCLIVSAWF